MVPNRRLKQARELRGWSQAKVAEEIGTDATTVSRWERGIFSPTPYFRERLCKLFSKNAAELGLLEPAYQPPEDEEGPFFPPPTGLSSFQANGAWPREDVYAGTVTAPTPPSWLKRTDTFSYIMHSAAHDQQAHMLWGDAYVRALQGQRTEAQQLGEASMSAFERVGHLNAAAIREWLNQRDLLAPPPTSAPTVPLPILPDQHQKAGRRFLRGKGTGIALILMLVVLIFAGFSFVQWYPTALASSPAAKAAAQANSLAGLTGNLTPTPALSPVPTRVPAVIPTSAPSVPLTAKVTPATLTPQYCQQESLGYRCDVHLWLFAGARQGSFTWRVSDASTLMLDHSPLNGSGASGNSTQITVYVQPNGRGQQLIFTFTFGSYTTTAATTWEG